MGLREWSFRDSEVVMDYLPLKKSSQQCCMLAIDDSVFRLACGYGHLETANWLWSICSEQEQSTMLHAKDNNVFRWACQKGHIKIAKWLWAICPDLEQKAMLHAQDRGAFVWRVRKVI